MDQKRFKLLMMSGGKFTPASLPSSVMAVWLDASDNSTLTNDGLDLISQIRDKSGNNNHANATLLGRPTLTSAVQNGLDVLRFVSPNLLQLTSRLTLTGEYTIFTVLSIRVMTGTRIYLGDSLTDVKLGHTTPSTQRHFVRSISTGSSDQNVVYPTAINVFGLISIARDANNKVDYQFNNTTPVRLYADVAQVGTTPVHRIGNDNSGTTGWNGDIAEFIVVNTSNKDLIAKINNYLITKYNV